ncbi:post-GPI attachment to proteins factor 3-like [Limulus polyphemus]|uniref:Post-GPI attachment to proteins factor 3 n=1 Tax=Limulus polyphemus TaxID=6850 RepID=A0ABM1C3P8_LIMPO|nr:post-GPI attachment to proteins factor 3-like [Limulus polyphemus]
MQLYNMKYPHTCCFYKIAFILCLLAYSTVASVGDRSKTYQLCQQHCYTSNCSDSKSLAQFKASQPWYMSILYWQCWEECQYNCMWQTVHLYRKYGHPIPQFHGKWPFIRLWGIQEPASVFFSVLNGLSHLIMWKKFKLKVPKDAPYYRIWSVQALLSINAWLWSAVFHSRDTPFTEKMDYYCAFSLILYAFYCLCTRVIQTPSKMGSSVIAVPFLSYFFYHIYHLSFVHFDYGYNMKANIIVGVLNSCGWLIWCYKNRHRTYMWKCALSVIVLNGLLLLEVADFPPWHFVLDAHALWHFGTVPLPFLWYSFLIDDTLSALEERRKND